MVTRHLAFQFTAAALVWGSSFLFMKVGLQGLSFTQVVLARLVLGTAALALMLWHRGIRLPRVRSVWMHGVVLAFVQCLIPWCLFSWAEQSMDSGTASIYNAATPLMTTALALAVLPEERPGVVKTIGLGLGFVGVLVVFAPWDGALTGNVTAQLACLGATASYGVALVYLRRFVLPLGLSSLTVASLQVGIAAALMIPAAPWVAASPVHLTVPVVLSMLALGCAGTGLAFVWMTNVVSGWGPAAASTVTYASPVVGIALGAAVLGESVHWNEIVGAVAVVVGILITTKRSTPAAESGRPGSPDDPVRLGLSVPPAYR